jgi:hypothetical protein
MWPDGPVSKLGFFPAFRPPPAWVSALTSIFEANRAQIDSLVVHAKRMESDDVLRVLADDLERDTSEETGVYLLR